MKFESYLLGVVDNRGRNPEYYMSLGKYPVIDNYLIKNELYPKISNVKRYIDDNLRNNFIRENVYAGMVLMTLVGEGIGNVTTAPNDQIVIIQNTIGFKVNPKFLNDKYLYYYLKSQNEHIRQFNRGSGQPSIRKTDILGMDVDFPSIECQEKIVDILSCFDEKIENNQRINNNLQQQVFAFYRQMFIDTANDKRRKCRADEYFDIAIGKTPPRKEPEWFSDNRTDNMVWVSISDMGDCGLFISDSSEYLTQEAVNRFNVVVVPDKTVLLSFKLTVGRVAIANGTMTTNEAIAHFKTKNKAINEYLYCYLNLFNYQTMGSTSSIATAVNSKIIKAMPFVVPTDRELEDFHGFAAPCFEKILQNQLENNQLAVLRDSLLPKLMSGEIDVSDVEI